jgi:TolB-like protein
MVAVLALLAVFLWLKVRSAPPREGQLIHSLVVLPLTNLSHDPEQEYFADGMTEALITLATRRE